MPRFLTPLRYEDLEGVRWRVLEPLVFLSDTYPGQFIVPVGFEMDMASIPRVLWAVLPKSGKYNRAAVVHDCAYAGALRSETGQRQNVVKVIADTLFYEAMRADGVGRITAWLMYRAVKAFGNPDLRELEYQLEVKAGIVKEQL